MKTRRTSIIYQLIAIAFALLLGVVPVMAVVMNDESSAAMAVNPEFRGGTRGTKNVILLIGDGMGQAQVTDARWEKAGENLGTYATTRLSMDGMEQACTALTYSADSFIPDSASAGTAIACGEKTDNGVISQDATAVFPGTSGKDLTSILELAEKSGRSSGVVTTTRITHATPAVFYAHTPNRDDEVSIADQLVKSKVDVAFGGGATEFVPSTVTDPFGKAGLRTDGRNLMDEATGKGYKVITTSSEMASLSPSDHRVIGLFSSSHMAYEHDRAGTTTQPSLSQMTGSAIRILSQDRDGFFLMVEGGRIDHACHERRVLTQAEETLEFDNAVKIALDFARRTDTLVIVTADHETGGLALGSNNAANYQGNMVPTFGSGLDVSGGYLPVPGAIKTLTEATHTAVDVPLLITGPKAAQICHGPIDDTRIFTAMKDAMRV